MSSSTTNPSLRNCLVAVVTNDADLLRFTDEHWYRVPARSLGKSLSVDTLNESTTLALYQTGGIESGLPSAIEQWGEMTRLEQMLRREIIPGEPDHPALTISTMSSA